MANIAIIGSGNVGANAAFFVAEHNLGHVLMYDTQDGLARGKALDMMEAAPLRGYQYGISAVDRIEEVMDSEVAIVAVGAVRAPGATRDSLYPTNVPVIRELAGSFKGYGGVVVLATEPVDAMVMEFVRHSGLPRERVLGLGGALDAQRMTYLVAQELGICTDGVTSTVIGRHNAQMIPLLDYSRINGVALPVMVESNRLSAIVDAVRSAGDQIVNWAKVASSYYGPAAAACDVAQAIVGNTNRVLSLSFVWNGAYGIDGVAMSLPVMVGKGGVQRVLEPKLAKDQVAQLQASAAELRALVKA